MNIKKKILLIILTIISIFSFAKIIIYYINSYQNKKTNQELIEKSIEKIDNKHKINYSKINNEDVVGWIIMNQNKINYPILKSNDNNFYLTRDYNKKHNHTAYDCLIKNPIGKSCDRLMENAIEAALENISKKNK